MQTLTLNEVAALQLVLSCTSVTDLIKAAMTGFAESDTVNDQDNADLCNKALFAFLK